MITGQKGTLQGFEAEVMAVGAATKWNVYHEFIDMNLFTEDSMLTSQAYNSLLL